MRGIPLVVGGLTLLVLLSLGALVTAETPDREVVTGTVTLTAQGTTADNFHQYFTDLGLPVVGGDTVVYSWAVNGSGPAVYFEIHEHDRDLGYVRHYSTIAVEDAGEWTQPHEGWFMVYWENLRNHTTVQIAYTLERIPGAEGFPFVYVLPGVAVAGVVLGWWGLRRRRGGGT